MKVDITSIILLLLILCIIYYTGERENYVNINKNIYEYREFWAEDIPGTKKYFNMLLDPLDITKKIYLHSVFGVLPYEGDYTNKDEIHILVSGESWTRDNLDNYDVKLIMEETDLTRGIICHPWFIVDSYVYNYWPRYMNVRQPTEKKKFCIFVVSNDNSYNVQIRNRFFEKLNMYKKIDSGGGALNNMGIMAPRNNEENGDFSYHDFLSEYKFMICFENTNKPNYLTEKLANAYLGNTVPIYWGASKVRKWFNNDAILQLEDTATEEEMDRLVNRIREIDNNDNLYNEIYNQPLMYEIPDELKIDNIRENIKQILN